MIDSPKMIAFFTPSLFVCVSFKKNVNVIGIIGKTQGVISDVSPAINASTKSDQNESFPNVDSPSRIDSSSVGPLIFFFQAEDGIRDLTVTGVQTCALPI